MPGDVFTLAALDQAAGVHFVRRNYSGDCALSHIHPRKYFFDVERYCAI